MVDEDLEENSASDINDEEYIEGHGESSDGTRVSATSNLISICVMVEVITW